MKANRGRMARMIKWQHERTRFWLLLMVTGLMAIVLPSVGGQVFASPDETAVAEVAQQMAWHGRAFFSESQAFDFPWLHPRSFVSSGNRIVPVGFLGWPFLLSLVARVFNQQTLPWAGTLLALSSIWPLYQLLKRAYGWEAAWWGTAITFSVPSVLLYLNRSLFPNSALFALGLWSFWLICHTQEKRYAPAKQFWFQVLIGSMLAACAAIRPIELIWLAPWWIWFGWKWQPQKKDWLGLFLGLTLIVLPILVLAHNTYGSAWQIGYFLHDNPGVTVNAPQTVTSATDAYTVLPFGFHPRMLMRNIILFFGGWLLPWFALGIFAGFQFKRTYHPVFGLMLWTLGVLLFVYGSGIYLDGPGAWQATLGNSFLRYFLPVSVFFGWAFAYLYAHYFSRTEKHRLWGLVFGTLLIVLGIFGAFFCDNEGLFRTRAELLRYTSIRMAAHQWFSAPRDVIVSDRSDKIFFPEFRTASPLAPATDIARLVHTPGIRVGLFSRPLSQSDQDAWREVGIEAQELLSSARERLYRLVPIQP